ncbi:uncharacterized protein LOC6645996 isoform X1 [Drosophila willistoni]|uniref:uncharacterized protein LOC6645996 isoform X1 n=1 Tax=Drosophila willistoni TaxID=7260 RepID=UPI00017D8424|nr:uncharacterized protein LOC6645996 isoform X1 [Drosophila willistoni]
MWLNLCLIILLAFTGSRVTANPAVPMNEDCEFNNVDTMHDFCCDLHDESRLFTECQINWHEKIHYTNDQEEQLYMFCTSECTFNSSDFLRPNRQSLNLRAVREHLESELADDADEALLYQTYIKCDKHAISLLPRPSVKQLAKRLTRYGCHPYPGLVMECVSNEMILNCPAHRFHESPQCKTSRDYLRECMHYVKY